MSSKKFNINWPPVEGRTVKHEKCLGRLKCEALHEIPTETSYRVNQKEQADPRGI